MSTPLGPVSLALAPLQQTPEGLLATVVQYSEFLSAVLGLFIAYQAFRGYRRNDSRPMLYLSAGFVLALGVPLALVPVFLLTPLSRVVVGTFTQASELAGLVAIVHALRVEP